MEWLIKKAADDISKLPSLESKFPDNPSYFSEDDKRIVSSTRCGFEVELENESLFQKQQLAISSSTSETSKGSRSENRLKARERARERAAKDKDREQQIDESQHNSQNSSFTELLTSGGGGGGGRGGGSNPNHNHSPPTTGFFLKQARHHSPPASMDYFSSGLFGQSSSSRNQFASAFSPHFGVTMPPPFNLANEQPRQSQHPELQQFSFLSDHLIQGEQPGSAMTGTDYNLNFSMSSSLAGYNRGTLQSNSPSPLPPHLQRFAFPADGSNMLFCVGNPTNSATPTAAENHQFPLQLYYGDGSRHSDSKGKDKR